jgi:hypothetical protein
MAPTPFRPGMFAKGGHLFYRYEDGRVRPVVRGGADEPTPLADLLTQAADPSQLDDDQLATLDADITAAAERLAESDDLTDDDLAQLGQAADATDAIRAEAEAREAAAAERQAQAQDALARIRGTEAEAAEGDDGEPADGEDGTEGDDGDEGTEGEGATEQPAPVAEGTDPAGDGAGEGEGEQPAQLAADATPAPRRRAPLTRVAARRPAAAAPRAQAPAPDLASMNLVAAANAPGTPAGSPITDYDQLAAAFMSAFDATKGYRHGPPVKVPVVRAGSETASQYPESHRLDSNRRENMRKIQAVQAAIQREGGIQAAITAAGSLVAAGGICAPQNVRYDLPVLGSDERPVRDQFLTRFGADRGGIATLPPPVLEDLDGAIDFWTEANDQDPGSDGNATKPCLTITCPTEDETLVEAVTKCIQTGNFRARYFPEQVEAWMRLASTNHARQAEQRLLATIATGSTAVTSGQVLGTTRDVLASLDRANAVWRYRHRDQNIVLEFGAPVWLRDQIRTDIARQLPVGTVEETLAIADATIDRFFASRNIDPVWLLDGESGQRFTVQGAGPLQGWPTTAKTYLAPAGGWLFLDGGSLDLGLVRDSTLNSTNDVQMFAETFEGAHFHGVESWTLTFDTCPDGSVSATVDINPCDSGS